MEYSGKFENMEEAQECKERAGKRCACDFRGKEIEYEIVTV